MKENKSGCFFLNTVYRALTKKVFFSLNSDQAVNRTSAYDRLLCKRHANFTIVKQFCFNDLITANDKTELFR